MANLKTLETEEKDRLSPREIAEGPHEGDSASRENQDGTEGLPKVDSLNDRESTLWNREISATERESNQVVSKTGASPNVEDEQCNNNENLKTDSLEGAQKENDIPYENTEPEKVENSIKNAILVENVEEIKPEIVNIDERYPKNIRMKSDIDTDSLDSLGMRAHKGPMLKDKTRYDCEPEKLKDNELDRYKSDSEEVENNQPSDV